MGSAFSHSLKYISEIPNILILEISRSRNLISFFKAATNPFSSSPLPTLSATNTISRSGLSFSFERTVATTLTPASLNIESIREKPVDVTLYPCSSAVVISAKTPFLSCRTIKGFFCDTILLKTSFFTGDKTVAPVAN